MKILFLTRSLASGGAERQLTALASGLAERDHKVVIAQFYAGGQLERDLDKTNVRVCNLNKQGRWSNISVLLNLCNIVRQSNPDIIHGYLGIPNIFSVILGKLFPSVKVVWGIRASDMDLSQYDWVARLFYRVECRLSHRADLIIANSNAGQKHALKNGFPAQKMLVINNGIDTIRFTPDRESGAKLRQDWGITTNQLLVGIVARIDPMKDHETFLRAAQRIHHMMPECKFVCIGRTKANALDHLNVIACELEIESSLVWAGERSDMSTVYNAFDLLCQSSITESFPNVVAEAMACGVPCVATDVGDTSFIIGDTGRVVPPRQPESLAEAIVELLRRDQSLPASDARDRIVELFSISHLVDATEHELLTLVNKGKT